jgi:hypothetical protein
MESPAISGVIGRTTVPVASRIRWMDTSTVPRPWSLPRQNGQVTRFRNGPDQYQSVDPDHRVTSQSFAGITGDSMSPLISMRPTKQPKKLGASGAGTRFATGRPFLVMTTGSLVAATSSMIFRHLALNSPAPTFFITISKDYGHSVMTKQLCAAIADLGRGVARSRRTTTAIVIPVHRIRREHVLLFHVHQECAGIELQLELSQRLNSGMAARLAYAKGLSQQTATIFASNLKGIRFIHDAGR